MTRPFTTHFNSLCKWAAGVSDTLALGILNESLGLSTPVTAAPCIKDALCAHPAYHPYVGRLTKAGVKILEPDVHVSLSANGLAALDWPAVVFSMTRQSRIDALQPFDLLSPRTTQLARS